MILLIGCLGSPGENEDALGVPRPDLAGCTSTTTEDDGDTQVDTYDDNGHLAERAYDDVTILFTTTLDDAGRPVRTETPIDQDVTWTETAWVGGTWKVETTSRGRNADTYATTTWEWSGDTVTLVDDSDDRCHTVLTMDGLRWVTSELVCDDGDVSQIDERTWQDDRVVEHVVDQPQMETVTTLRYTWDGGLLVAWEMAQLEHTTSYDVTWGCP